MKAKITISVVVLVVLFVGLLALLVADHPEAPSTPPTQVAAVTPPAPVPSAPKVKTPKPDPAPKDLGDSIVARVRQVCGETAANDMCKWLMIYAAECKVYGYPQKSAHTTCIEMYHKLGGLDDREDSRAAMPASSGRTGTDLDNVDPSIQAMCAKVLSMRVSDMNAEEEGWKGKCLALAWK